jgi:NAD(P)H dehydrogenase (quinone)
MMYAITGITGQVGGALAQALLAADAPVRAIVRDEQKGKVWAARGCEVAVAEMADATALTAAFRGAEAVFILPPPVFDPTPGYEEAWKVINAVVAALKAAQPRKVVCLSTVGADASRDNLLSQRTLLEEALSRLSLSVTFLRAAWFLENAAWDVASARESGVIHSFLMPLEKPLSMVSALDVGRVAAQLIRERWSGLRVVELEGPGKVSPNDLAAAFTRALGRAVRAEIVPRATWEQLFRSQGMKNPGPRIAMLDGFNEGWIAFPGDGAHTVKGRVGIDEVVASLVSPLP